LEASLASFIRKEKELEREEMDSAAILDSAENLDEELAPREDDREVSIIFLFLLTIFSHSTAHD
jgi:hypothetical protein